MKRNLVIAMLLAASMLTACGNNTVSSTQNNGSAVESAEGGESTEEESESGETTEEESGESLGKDIRGKDSREETENEESTIESAEIEESVVGATGGSKKASGNATASDVSANSADLFTDRDLEQSPDLSDAKYLTLEDGKDISITEAGIYVISGNVSNTQILVDAGDEDKVQLVLDGAVMTNETKPCIYVKSADKVFVTTTKVESSLTVSGNFVKDGDTNTDAVIFSKDDLVLNGTGVLKLSSTDNAVTSKDTLKITGGNMKIECTGNALEAHDAVNIYEGTIDVTGCNDGIHSKDSDDDSKGSIAIFGGTININASDDAIHGTTVVQIDGGTFALTGKEGIEGTSIVVNGGTIDITASDDGINAASKSSKYTPAFEINDGSVKITMGQGDTDGIDSNGNIYVNGGTLDITGQSAFDYDGQAEYNGGTIIENGTETNTITNQMMGGHGGMGGQRGGNMGGQRGNFGGQFDQGSENQFEGGSGKQFDGNMGNRPDGAMRGPHGRGMRGRGGNMDGNMDRNMDGNTNGTADENTNGNVNGNTDGNMKL